MCQKFHVCNLYLDSLDCTSYKMRHFYITTCNCTRSDQTHQHNHLPSIMSLYTGKFICQNILPNSKIIGKFIKINCICYCGFRESGNSQQTGNHWLGMCTNKICIADSNTRGHACHINVSRFPVIVANAIPGLGDSAPPDHANYCSG